MNLNDHIEASADALTYSLKIAMKKGLHVKSAHIGARNPRIVLAEAPPAGMFQSAIFSRIWDGTKTQTRAVAMVEQCQVEWKC